MGRKNEISPDRSMLRNALSVYRNGLDAMLSEKALDRLQSDLGKPLSIPWLKSASEKTDAPEMGFRVVAAVDASTAKEKRIRSAFDIFNSRMLSAVTRAEKQELMIELLYEIDSDKKRLFKDRKAFERLLDLAGVVERYKLALRDEERVQEKGLLIIGELFGKFLENDLRPDADRLEVVRSILAENYFEDAINGRIEEAGAWQLRVAALQIYNRIVPPVKEEMRRGVFAPKTVAMAVRLSRNSHESAWVQKEALRFVVLNYPEDALSIFESRLIDTDNTGDDLFVRAAAVRMIGEHFPDERGASLLKSLIAKKDPSDHVRVETAKTLSSFPFDMSYPLLAQYFDEMKVGEICPQVRAAAAESLGILCRAAIDRADGDSNRQVMEAAQSIADAMTKQPNPIVCRIALEELASIAVKDIRSKRAFTPIAKAALSSIDARIEDPAEELFLKRLAWPARERILVEVLPGAEIARRIIETHILPLYEGKRTDIPIEQLEGCPMETLSRILADRAENDFGYFIDAGKKSIVVQKGERWGISLWRVLHEMRNPSPDKRKSFSHTVGRKPFGNIRIPSHLLAELTKTRVPGEPLYIEAEGGWRPFAPLLTDCLSLLAPSLDSPPVRIHTSLGITVIECRLPFMRRLANWLKLSWNFERLADMRNSGLDGRDLQGPVEYFRTLKRDYGIECRHEPYRQNPDGAKDPPRDPALGQMFSSANFGARSSEKSYAASIAPFLGGAELLWEQFKSYFSNLSENNIYHLWLFFVVGLLVFLGNQLKNFYQIKQALSKLPLIIGGWGTRGKSGVERKKAALFHALGYDIFSKTTGCEAMFLHSTSEQRPAEIFLYRPYDKASIWEMGKTAELAADLNADIYLWECMALNPRFVRLLQKDWMKDSISTITNTYPDHEDVQGPAGIDIPRVMTEFLPPPGRVCYTSEDQMLPILRDAARKGNVELIETSWRESAMLTQDVLDRYPYKVHPKNLALVLRMAEHFAIDRDFALKTIADHIVPDLGVLKAYPVAEVEGRRLEFTNAMSANERRGFNDSWRRAGHAAHSDESEPGTWIVTVVNNRADRIPRSQVFAEVVVHDAFAHKHVLIGTNLKGLSGYIRAALERRLNEIDIYSRAPSSPNERMRSAGKELYERLNELKVETTSASAAAHKTRLMFPSAVLLDEESLQQAFNSAEEIPKPLADALEEIASEETREEILSFFRQWRERLKKVLNLYEMIEQARTPEAENAVNEAFRTFARDFFLSKLIVVEDSQAKGDEIIMRIARCAPPGYFVRIIGMQNIKGTGLDFVYRWLALERVQETAKQLNDINERRRMEAVDFFSYFEEYGLITRSVAVQALRKALENPGNESIAIRQRLESALRVAEFDPQMLKTKKEDSRFLTQTLDFIESFLESGDSKRRQKEAESVLRELVDKTVSHERAAVELRNVTLRQKGGWLRKKF